MHQVILEPCRWGIAEDIDPMGRYTLALVVLALLCASAAKSDSWGYFCETDGLLVYDLDHGSEPWQRLHLVRFGPGQQAFQQDVIAGPDAQIHAIRCESDSISILGGNRGWWEIRYAVSEGGKLALTSRESIDEARRQELMQPQTPNLGFLARASLDHKVFPSEQIELHSADREHPACSAAA